MMMYMMNDGKAREVFETTIIQVTTSALIV